MITIRELAEDELDIFRNIIIKSGAYSSSNIDLNRTPFVWYGHSALDWSIALKDNIPFGVILSRLVHNNYHLHCLYVDTKYQQDGYGKELIKYHWKRGVERNADLKTYTLHVNKTNENAINFYLKLGYMRHYDEDSIQEESGLEDWINNCRKCNDWPLREGHLLYYIKR